MNNLSSPAPILSSGKIGAGSSPITSPKEFQEDRHLDTTLRPYSFEEYAGQEKIKDNLKILIEAAKKRGEAIEHLLLHGSSGLGKTSLAHIIAKEIGGNIKITSGPALEKTGDLAAILTGLSDGDLLFIDECLEGDTLISLADGTLKKIKDIENGDKVVGGTVSSVFKKTVSETIKIVTSFNSLECSKTHPCVVARNGKIVTILAKNIRKSDYFLIPVQAPHTTKNNLSPSRAKFLALILCDGHINKNLNTIQIEASKDKKYFKETFKRGLKAFGITLPSLNKEGRKRKLKVVYGCYLTKRGSQMLRVYSRKLVKELISLGVPAGNKHDIIQVPTIILNAPIESVKAFISVCFCCEGWVINSRPHGGKDMRLLLDMNSKLFVQQLQLLLKKFGIHSSYYIRKREKDMYRLSVSGNNLKLFYERIGLILTRKSMILQQIYTSSHLLKYDLIPLPRFGVNNTYSTFARISRPVLENLLNLNHNLKYRLNYRYEKVKNIKKIKKRKSVYDFTTTEHTFIANGILTHNCHRLNKIIEETLYPAMEDYKLDIIIGKGPSAKTLRLDLPRFTLIGATTRIGLLSSPLRSRFGATYRLDFYEQKDIEKIINRSAGILNVSIEPMAVKIIASASRATPRVANRLLKRVRDFSQVKGDGFVNQDLAKKSFQMLEIDELGLEPTDRRLLRVMIEKFNGGPVGLQALSAAADEETDTIEEIYEPYLLQLGFLARTPRGRLATKLAYEHLGVRYNQAGQEKLL